LDTLRVKLFLAIAGANFVLVAAVYLIYSWSFDKGLFDYVNQSEEARLVPVISQLADGYRLNGNWTWVTANRERWNDLLADTLGWRTGRRDGMRTEWPRFQPPNLEERVPRPAPGDTGTWPALTIDWRLMLFDADGKLLIQPPPWFESTDPEKATRLPIQVDGKVVGYLGYGQRLDVLQSLESITARQQSLRFGVIAIGMLFSVLLTAALISSWLARRLRLLGAGAGALARGDYGTRLAVQGHDEVAQLANDFNHLAEALEAAQRGRQQWIADIAHELRTPLTTLRAEIEAVQDGVRPLTQASIASVGQEVHRLTRLVDDLRLLSLSDLGALTYRKAELDLAETIAETLAAGSATLQEAGISVEQQMQPDVMVEADPDRLAQVFGNLLQNTVRYTDAPGRLRVRLAVEGGEACIDWEDSSPGVSDEDLGRLTERLYRVDASRSSASGGTGLGLAIVLAIVSGHGGRMQADHSALGGLHWRIWLPLADHRQA
jgi:two-component system sensor histidine kinase BaeS